MREPSYYMSGGRLFILVEVTNRPTHPQPVCPYHHHHHYYCSSSSLLALTSSLALTVAMGAGRDNGRRWRQLLGQHCVCSGSSYDDTFMVVALGRASSWACSLGLGDYGGGTWLLTRPRRVSDTHPTRGENWLAAPATTPRWANLFSDTQRAGGGLARGAGRRGRDMLVTPTHPACLPRAAEWRECDGVTSRRV